MQMANFKSLDLVLISEHRFVTLMVRPCPDSQGPF